MLHDYHTYGYEIRPINGGKFYADASFAVIEPDQGEDGFYLECRSEQEAEAELLAQVQFAVADGC